MTVLLYLKASKPEKSSRPSALLLCQHWAQIPQHCFLQQVLILLQLLVHSTVDFIFNYPMLIGLWILLGGLLPSNEIETAFKQKPTTIWPFRISLSLVFMILSVLSIRLGLSESLIKKAEQLPSDEKNIQQAVQFLERSTALAFVPAEQHTNLAYLLLKDYLETNRLSSLNRAAIEINEALSMNPQDVHVLFLRSQIQYTQGYRAQARIELQKLMQQFPFR